MTLLDLHPDELLDRARRNVALSPAERERLKAHLMGCSVCRFVQQAARDFDEEVGDGETGLPSNLSDAIDSPGMLGSTATEKALPVAGRRAWTVRSPRFRGVATATGIVLLTGLAAAAQWVGVFHRSSHRSSTDSKRTASTAHVLRGPSGRGHGTTTRDSVEQPAPAVADPNDVLGATPNTPAAVDVPGPIAQGGGTTVGVGGQDSLIAPPEVAPGSAAGTLRAPNSSDGEFRGPSQDPFPGASAAAQNRPSPRAKPARSTRIAATDAAPATTASDLFAQANAARRNRNPDRALSLYERLFSEHGGSAEAQTSRAIVGRLLLDRHASAAALKNFDEYLAAGIGELREEVMVGRAGALAQLDRLEQERATWTALLRMFPHSAYAARARARIQVLTTLLSR